MVGLFSRIGGGGGGGCGWLKLEGGRGVCRERSLQAELSPLTPSFPLSERERERERERFPLRVGGKPS